MKSFICAAVIAGLFDLLVMKGLKIAVGCSKFLLTRQQY